MFLTDVDVRLEYRGAPRAGSAVLARVRRLVESLWLRLPRRAARRIRTDGIARLDVVVRDQRCEPAFAVRGGDARVQVCDRAAADALRRIALGRVDAVVARWLRRGIAIAAAHDAGLRRRERELRALVDTMADEFDFPFRSRVHPSRRWRAVIALRHSCDATALDVLVEDHRTGAVLARHGVRPVELPSLFFDADDRLDDVRWRGNALVGLDTRGEEIVHIEDAVPAVPDTAAARRRRRA
jgi:hypothetical protein